MGKKIEMQGGRYGRLVVIKEVGRKRKEVLWRCRCDCGNEVDVTGYNLRKGHTRSCGCLIPDMTRIASVKHGLSKSRICYIYTNMKTRCYNPNYYLFKHYGGKGITICDEWLGENGLANFAKWAFKNGYSDCLSIDRIDNDKGYSPSNCRWVTMKVQQNNRSNNRHIIVDGVNKTMAEWADYAGISYPTIQSHLSKGDVEDFIRRTINASG